MPHEKQILAQSIVFENYKKNVYIATIFWVNNYTMI